MTTSDYNQWLFDRYDFDYILAEQAKESRLTMGTYKHYKHNTQSRNVGGWDYQGKVKFSEGQEPPDSYCEIYVPVREMALTTKVQILLGVLWVILTAIKMIIDILK